MIKGGYFEIGTVILLENESNFAVARKKLNKTVNSLLAQTKIPVRIGVLALKCTFKLSLVQDYANGLSDRLTKAGVVSFDFTYGVDKDLPFKTHLINEYTRFIDKGMPITIYGKNDSKSKSRLKVSHFSLINAGSEYELATHYENIGKEYKKGKKSLVIYSNLIAKDDNAVSINISDLSDKFPVTFFSYGFKHFIINNSVNFIMDIYREIEKSRKEIKKEDSFINELNDNSYKDSVFSKTKDKVKI